MNILKNCSLFFCLFFLTVPEGSSQQYTLRDQEEIAYQAQLTLSMYKDLLNVISYAGLATESEIKVLIQNSYSDSRNQLFYSSESIIEDNLKPANLSSRPAQDKSIKNYLHYFDLAYEKTDGATIDFFDFETSNLKYSTYPYMKVKYTCSFKGRHKGDTTAYKAVDRIAELRVEKRDKTWKTFITSIIFYDPENPIHSSEGDVELDRSLSEEDVLSSYTNQVQTGNPPFSPNPYPSDHFSEKKAAQDSLFNHHLRLGEEALAAENLKEAFKAFSEAEMIYPFHQDLVKNLVQLTKAQNLEISSKDKTFEEVKLGADQAYANRNYLKAKRLYSEALQMRPTEETLKTTIKNLESTLETTALLESKYAMGNYQEALQDYTKAIRKDRNNPEYYYGRGKCYEKLKAFNEALEDYSKAIELSGNFVDALDSRARLFVETQQFPRAVADYTLILSNPEYAATYYPKRARVKQILGNYDGAVEDYNHAIRQNPEVADLYFEKGMIYGGRKKHREAIQSFNLAIEKDPQHIKAICQRGLAFAALNDLESASLDFKKARDLGATEEQLTEVNGLALAFFAKAEGAMAEKIYQRALENYNYALLISPDFDMAWLRKGDAYSMLEDYDQAILTYTKAVEHNPISQAYFKRALAYQQKEDVQSAGEDFKKYIPIGREMVARAERTDKGKFPETSLQATFAVERAEARYTLGYAQLMNQQYMEALENLNMAIHSRRFFPKAYFARGLALYSLENYHGAVENLEESIKMGFSDPQVFYSLGKAYVALGQTEPAVFSFSKTITLNPKHEAAYKERALCYKSSFQYALALDDLNTALSLDKTLAEDVTLITQKGLVELHLHQLQEANQSFEHALRLDKNNEWALYGKACAFAQAHKYREALVMYRKAFQTRRIDKASIMDDPLTEPIRDNQAFEDLVKTYLN